MTTFMDSKEKVKDVETSAWILRYVTPVPVAWSKCHAKVFYFPQGHAEHISAESPPSIS
ncbi:auxin response factor [Tripterygium wilfordii]|uniref:Auxin response factor n=1 Tax=Tripterygium wilfordii TaxID=458696 RepID=A0A7J7E1T4_TRIWF|nr:auxin response factor [Tripterygium wilfordii]